MRFLLRTGYRLWRNRPMLEQSTGGAPGRDPTPKGGGGAPPLRTPKLSHGTMCFVGAGGAGDFV